MIINSNGWALIYATACSLVLISSTLRGDANNHYDAPGDGERLRIERLAVVAMKSDFLNFPVPSYFAVGRTHCKMTTEQLPRITTPSKLSPSIVLQDTGSGINLWEAVKELEPPPASDLLLTFDVYAKRGKVLYLAMGCNDTAVVVCNNNTIYGTYGFREYIHAEDIIQMPVSTGLNHVSILCRKPRHWIRPPADNSADQWKVSVDLCGSSEAAWAVFRGHNFHLTDTPIVRCLDDIRVEAKCKDHDTAQFCDILGRVISAGRVRANGSVEWEKTSNISAQLGFIKIGTNDAEPLLITDFESPSKIAVASSGTTSLYRPNVAWRARLTHLSRFEYSKEGDNWWARKLVLAALMSEKREGCENLINENKPSELKLVSYKSHIDGTIQYFQFYRPRRAEPAKIAIIVLPSVGNRVRPFLQSVQLANLHDNEDLADIAAENNLAVIWPGLADVDYGGEYSRTVVAECLKAASALLPPNTKYVLIGTCSSGVLGLGYAQTREIDGLVLQTPIVGRYGHRWLPGLDVDGIGYPAMSLQEEQTVTRINELVSTPILLIYNRNVQGHGDLAGSKWLYNQLLSKNANIKAHWETIDQTYLWGESQRAAYAPVSKWLYLLSHRKNNRTQTVSRQSSNHVKPALLSGFYVQPTADPILSGWFERWFELLSKYRGDRPSISPLVESCCKVRGRVLDTADMESIKASSFFVGTNCLNLGAGLTVEDGLWGFRLCANPDGSVVEVFRTPNAQERLPNLDLIVDGCCAGAIWKQQGTQWRLVQVWD